MGFEVVQGSPVELWVQVVDSDTLYAGQIVSCQANEGLAPIGAASGNADTSGKIVPYGVVLGFNLYNEAFDSTYKANKATDATPLASTTEFVMHEGVNPRGDGVLYANIALITPETILKGPIFNAALGTATLLGTVTTGDASAVSCTVNTLEVAGVAGFGTVYFRTGANLGYRVTTDTSATAITWDKPMKNAVAVGDTLVRVNGLRPNGPSYAQFDSESMYIDSNAALTSDYYVIDVIKLDLSEASKEHVLFKFNADHFALKRA